MKNMINELQTLIPVPDSPIDVDESKLQSMMKELGTALPEDYLEYCKIYGSGTIVAEGEEGGYDWEFVSAFRTTFPQFVDKFFSRQDPMRKAGWDEVKMGLYPETGGLLPFGKRNDVYFTWRTIGKPNDWKVVVMWGLLKNDVQSFDMGFSEFLHRFLMKEFKVAGFVPKWNHKTDITFENEVYGCP